MRCLLVYPRFRTPSFWNYRATCEGMGARYPGPPLGLITVAAMLPKDWEVRLLDCNVQRYRPQALDWADVVLVGGMIVQQPDALDIIRAAKARGKRVVVGGPDATSSPHLYEEADHLVLGEAEATLPRFLADLEAGTTSRVYTDPERPDVTASPCPRFDLLEFGKYLHVGVQWCRGCPFSCEFCDIIELYGRVPRAKTSAQMLEELQTLYDLGYRGHVDFVDDNFIGNKKLAKAFLPDLRDWLEERGWPFEFSTEASLNLADDDVLLGLMKEVGFFSVFVGIETPDEETLIATKKRQNTKRSITDSVRKIQQHGMFVTAGYIIGFDTERGSVADAIVECVEAAAIPVSMVGLLAALPTTQLTRRLAKEGRLHEDNGFLREGQGDQCTGGLNFDTRRPRAEILRDYVRVVEALYRPEAYFDRVLRTCLRIDASKRRVRLGWRGLPRAVRAVLSHSWRLGFRRDTRGPYWKLLWRVGRENPKALYHAVAMAALYRHLGPFATFVAGRTREAVAREDSRPEADGPAPAAVREPARRRVPSLAR
jgi:radical SAM superfamily enzyme YgiQ (UPF0313 family)